MSKKYLTTYVTNYLEKNWISENKNVGNNNNIANSNNQSSELKPKVEQQIYNIPGDATWDYKLEDGKWFTKKQSEETGWLDISGNKEAVDKLNSQFPDAKNQNQQKNTGGGRIINGVWKADVEQQEEEIQDYIATGDILA